MGKTSKTFFLFIVFHFMSTMSAQEVDKRVPQGFVGMRGKKYLNSDEIDRYYKRRPQFFVGVKGKKSFDLDNPEAYYKRAPMGFVGMRGKKDPFSSEIPESYDYAPKTGSLFGQIDYTSNEDPKYFQLSEYPMVNDLLTQYLQKLSNSNEQFSDDETKEVMTNEVSKRAANIHQFFGVRGKKSIQNKRPFDLSFRGKFIGVRGKKDVKDSGTPMDKFLLDNNEPWTKRRGQMGFFGMRGKKWDGESSPEMETSQ